MISIALALKSLHHSIVRRVDQETKKLGITEVQFMVLKYLFEKEGEDVFQKDIEKLLDIRGATATGILQNLTSKGFIDRVSVPTDARLKKIVLCDKSKDMVKDFEKSMEKIQSRVEKNLTQEEKETFMYIAKKIKNAMQEETFGGENV